MRMLYILARAVTSLGCPWEGEGEKRKGVIRGELKKGDSSVVSMYLASGGICQVLWGNKIRHPLKGKKRERERERERENV